MLYTRFAYSLMLVLLVAETAQLSAVSKPEGRENFWTRSTQGSPDLAACRKRVEQKPDDADANNDLGWALRMNNQQADAEKFLRRAIVLSPKMSQAYSNLAVVLLDENKSAEALGAAKEAVALDGNQPVYRVVLGNAMVAEHDLDGAISQYQAAIGLKPDYENAHYNLGRALNLKGDGAKAQLELSKAIGLDPDDDRALMLLDKLISSPPAVTAK